MEYLLFAIVRILSVALVIGGLYAFFGWLKDKFSKGKVSGGVPKYGNAKKYYDDVNW